jgi:hypothetical protein
MSSDNFRLSRLSRRDGRELLELSRACPINADFSLHFDRSPDFFAWPDQAFDEYQGIGIRADGRLIGCVGAGISMGWIGSSEGRIAYYGDARIHPDFRGKQLAARAALALAEQLRSQSDVSFLIIKQGNHGAQKVVSRFFPDRVDIRQLGTFEAVNLILLRRANSLQSSVVRKAREKDIPELAELLAGEYRGRPFAPVVTAQSLASQMQSAPGLGPEHTYVAVKDGSIVGTIAAWDQGPFKRTVLLRYSKTGQLLRLVHRLGRIIHRRAAPLPAPGEAFRSATITRVAVRNRDPAVLQDLLAAAVNDHIDRGYHLLHLGLTKSDPLMKATGNFFVQRYRSDLFAAAWRDSPAVLEDIYKNSDPYVDLANV